MDAFTPPVPGVRPRLVSGPLALVFLCSFSVMTGFYLLLSVVPLYATSIGVGGIGAGLATGALMLSTVVAELALPRLTTRFGYRRVLVAGLLLLGLPALALPGATGMAAILAVCLVRGLGFAVAVVVGGALVAALVPPERRAEGLGVSGIVIGVPAMIALPVGVWLTDRVGYPPVFLAAAATCLISLVAVLCLPSDAAAGIRTAGENDAARLEEPLFGNVPVRRDDGVHVEAGDGAAGFGMVAGLRSPAMVRPSLVFAVSAMGTGIVATFLPATVSGGDVAAAGLLVQATTATLGRWWAGRVGDRIGSGRLLAPGMLVAAAGMLTLFVSSGTIWVMAAMTLFGAGFGVAQNASLAVMFERVPTSGYGTVSAMWNLAYDSGMGLGGVGFGLVAAQTGHSAAYALTGAMMLLTLPLALRDRTREAPRPAGIRRRIPPPDRHPAPGRSKRR